jgi:hypothetical protein
MGWTGRKLVAGINWENTVAQLLGNTKPPAISTAVKKRKKITVALTFPVFPPEEVDKLASFTCTDT